MEESMDTRGALVRHRSDTLTRLVALASEGRKPADADAFRQRAERLAADLNESDRILAIMNHSEKPERYRVYKRAIDAIDAYFEETGVPATEEDIVKALMDGGFRGSTPAAATNVSRSIGIYLSSAPGKSGKIKKIGELIGPFDWPDSLFNE